MQSNSSTVNTHTIAMTGLSVALLAVLAQIAIPLPVGVPISLGTLGIVLVGIIFGAKRGAFIVLMYLLLGAVGVPVFAGFQGGLGMFLDFAGGFRYSFPLLVLCAGAGRELAECFNKPSILWIGLIAGTLINYTFGLFHFMFVTGMGFAEAIILVVAPFVLGDFAKLAIGVALATPIRKALFPEQTNN